jgi:hypothetical protein
VLGLRAFDPPEARNSSSEESALGVASDKRREVYSAVVPMPSKGLGNPGLPGELSVYKTQAAWRACDVYAALVPPSGGFTSGCLLSVFVYAVSRGSRTLVATGRQFVEGTIDAVPMRWVAAARSIAERFEVTVMCTQNEAAVAFVGQIALSVVATDEAVEPPPWVGLDTAQHVYLFGSNTPSRMSPLNVNSQAPAHVEIVRFAAVNHVAADRYLMLFDTLTGANPANGARPIMVWGLGATLGAGIAEELGYRAQLGVPQLLMSSTYNTLTIATDGLITGLCR